MVCRKKGQVDVRSAGPLTVGPGLREALDRYRLHHGIAGPAQLSLEAVQTVEQLLRVGLPDGVWAYLAAAGREPLQVITHTEDALEHGGFPRRYIAFHRDKTRRSYACVDRRALEAADPVIVEWTTHDVGRESWPNLAKYILSLCDTDEDLDDEGVPAPPSDRPGAALDPTEPAIVEVSELEQSARRVLHSRFGEGVVLRTIPAPVPKLEIDFGQAGVKLVLATYVTDVAAAEPQPVVP